MKAFRRPKVEQFFGTALPFILMEEQETLKEGEEKKEETGEAENGNPRTE